mmetsp:Transcript_5072/g.12271  ORF Transcript_5072/g.12271 Transcript_5072/m.12271 type:complete len:112 (-) Transcript_5072:445-780(-)
MEAIITPPRMMGIIAEDRNLLTILRTKNFPTNAPMTVPKKRKTTSDTATVPWTMISTVRTLEDSRIQAVEMAATTIGSIPISKSTGDKNIPPPTPNTPAAIPVQKVITAMR